MDNWSEWMEIEHARLGEGPFADFGIYQIRAINQSGSPISIGRFVGIDTAGILYIGRSGFRSQKTGRTLGNRIDEWLKSAHSGGFRFQGVKHLLDASPAFRGYRLQAQAKVVPDNEIGKAEVASLQGYSSVYAELPPINSSMPSASESHL